MDNFVLDVLRVIDEFDTHGDLWWRTDGEYAPVTFFINCNDLFAWGCADCETVTPENLPLLRQSYLDAKDAGNAFWGDQLFCCRARKMRPQGACYPDKDKYPALWALIDACGDPRQTGFGNPYEPGAYKPKT